MSPWTEGIAGDFGPVVSQAEYGARGMAVLTAKYGTRQVNKWRAMGGRKPDPTLLEIRERERTVAATRRERRVRTPRRARIESFDTTT